MRGARPDGQSVRQLRLIDTALLAILVPLWVLSFAQSLRSSLEPPAFPPLVVSGPEQAGGYPVVVDTRTWPAAPEPALRRGDRIVEMAGADLRDVGGSSSPSSCWSLLIAIARNGA